MLRTSSQRLCRAVAAEASAAPSKGRTLPKDAARSAFARNRARHELNSGGKVDDGSWASALRLSREQYLLLFCGGAFLSVSIRLNTNKTKHERETDGLRILLDERKEQLEAFAAGIKNDAGGAEVAASLHDMLRDWRVSEGEFESDMRAFDESQKSYLRQTAAGVKEKFTGAANSREE